jgi:hypothetical protein
MSKNLEQTFYDAIGAFNRGKYEEELAPLLDPDIILKRVDDPGSVVGIGNVMAYLKFRQGKLNPQLDVTKPMLRQSSPTLGQVSGEAVYHDQNGDDGIPVRFTFTFARGNENDAWLLVNGFAAPA